MNFKTIGINGAGALVGLMAHDFVGPKLPAAMQSGIGGTLTRAAFAGLGVYAAHKVLKGKSAA